MVALATSSLPSSALKTPSDSFCFLFFKDVEKYKTIFFLNFLSMTLFRSCYELDKVRDKRDEGRDFISLLPSRTSIHHANQITKTKTY